MDAILTKNNDRSYPIRNLFDTFCVENTLVFLASLSYLHLQWFASGTKVLFSVKYRFCQWELKLKTSYRIIILPSEFYYNNKKRRIIKRKVKLPFSQKETDVK